MCNFLLMWMGLQREVFRHKKGLRKSEGLCIHDGGDEGDRTPDLLTASQALSQLSYAPVTRRYYKGMFPLMQGLFVETFSYGFSWDGAELTDFDFGKISQFTHRPDKTLMLQIRYCSACMDFDLCDGSHDVTDARVGQQAQRAVV